ncbi:MAG: S1 RNA-binding domain-containing protein, partial [Acidobacteriota bacterium]
ETLPERYPPGAIVECKITKLTEFGAFAEIEDGIEGLIHISDISWKKIRHPSDVLKQGDEIEVIILNIDVEKQKLSLGIKQLEGDIWEDFFKRQRMGDIVHVKIVRIADFGVFVEITPGIEGVVFLSELDENKIENPGEVFKVGEQRNAKLIKLNQKEKKISLSFRQALLDQQKMEYQRYSKSQDGSLTLGDIMRDQLNAIDLKPKQKDGGKKVEADKPPAEKKAKPTAKKKTEETPDSQAKEKTAKVEKPKKKEAAKTVPKKKKAEEKTAKKEKKEESPTKNKKEDIVNKVAAKAKNIEEDSGEKEEKKND